MVRAATAGEPLFRVSDVEIRREGPSFTVDTLRAMRDDAPDAELFLVIGIDQHRTFDSWREPEAILGLARLAVMDREGDSVLDADSVPAGGPELDADHAREDLGGRVVAVHVQRVDVSSTQVRDAVARGESVTDLVSPEVARIIEAEGLYRRRPT